MNLVDAFIRFRVNSLSRVQSALALSFVLLALGSVGCNNLNSQALNSEGVRLYQQGNYQQASIRFQQAIAQNPNGANGYYNLAAALHKSGTLYNRPSDLRQAEVLYNQCLERDGNHTDCYRGLAVLLSESNRQDEAFRLLSTWNVSSPQLADPRIELARLYEESGNQDQARVALVEAITLEPNNARALTALGRLRDQSGDYSQALADYQRSLQINRFQPDVAARVATLQATAGPATSIHVDPNATRLGSNPQWQPSVKY